MGSDHKVAPEEAALSLSKELQYEPWFLTVGVGQELSGATALFVYAKSVKAARLRQLVTWNGYKVYIRPLTARPANSPHTLTTSPAKAHSLLSQHRTQEPGSESHLARAGNRRHRHCCHSPAWVKDPCR